ncbi:hypothetical protein [Desulfoscipio gibsoniae]|uniref:Uncharacterized protein n=1 Tax=Desulfoscipio gibsoniae DSM 7213 TaxID=767817 RepID=R4KD78_9FIRM|nr:hypothetical protein [Desulfoscipio gibsoniae]AGK99656.1 hypothetical protein Desgi_0036 [Desulfoscipio gibsoniae DSM 7213]
MTLVISANNRDEYALVTGDFLGRKHKDMDYNNPVNHNDSDVELVNNVYKTLKVSDYVLLGAAGCHDLGEWLRKEIQDRAAPDFDLIQCRQLAEEIVEEMRDKRTLRITFDMEPLYLNHLYQENGFAFVLTGFYKEGGTGYVSFESNPDGGTFTEKNCSNNRGYQLFTPANNYRELMDQYFELRDGITPVITTAMAQALCLHHIIVDHMPEHVSREMEILILQKQPGQNKPCFGRIKLTDQSRDSAIKTAGQRYADIFLKPMLQTIVKTKPQKPSGYVNVIKDIAGLGKTMVVLGQAMKKNDMKRINICIDLYVAEVAKVNNSFAGLTPPKELKNYHGYYKKLMSHHTKAVKWLKQFQKTGDIVFIDRLNIEMDNIEKIIDKLKRPV